MSNHSLRVSLLQHEPVPADTSAALQRLDHFARAAAEDDSQLLVVPEASITGYNISESTMHAVALDADGEFTREVSALCKQHRIAIAYGFAEHHQGSYYNCVQLIDRSGSVAGKYRKTHLWGDLDRTLFCAGDTLTCTAHGVLAEIEGFKVGLLICYDVEFPECARALALQGAQLLVVPTGLMQPWREVAEQVVPVRAYENQLYVAYANYCGSEGDLTYEGRSCIVGPDGKDLARAEQQPELISATLTTSAIDTQRDALPYHRDRRPELYR
ncbi:MAG: carbon-nitrogen hydrolase family protein [Pseudomonadota bacterium]